jgi:hypothetical protein
VVILGVFTLVSSLLSLNTCFLLTASCQDNFDCYYSFCRISKPSVLFVSLTGIILSFSQKAAKDKSVQYGKLARIRDIRGAYGGPFGVLRGPFASPSTC